MKEECVVKFLWVIQYSNGKHYNWVALAQAIEKLDSRYIIKRKEELSTIDINEADFPIVIGGDDFLLEAKKNIKLINGIFESTCFFRVDTYMSIWKDDYLNFHTAVVTRKKLDTIISEKQEFFVRPLLDIKCFDGQVMDKIKVDEILYICRSCSKYGKKCFCVSPVQEIEKEWRSVIVNNEVVSICRYLKNGKRDVSETDVPEKLVEFCTKACSGIKAPVAWVMDVAKVKNRYYVLECNIFNASNFYDCNRENIVKSLENVIRKENKNCL